MARKCKIKLGASVGQDFAFFKWPKVPHPMGDESPVNLVFDAEPMRGHEGSRFELKADGYGGHPYGNGSLFVSEPNLTWITGLEGQSDER